METKTFDEIESQLAPPSSLEGDAEYTKAKEEMEEMAGDADQFEDEDEEEEELKDVNSSAKKLRRFVISGLVAMAVAALVATAAILASHPVSSEKEVNGSFTYEEIPQELLDQYEAEKNMPDAKTLLEAERREIVLKGLKESMEFVQMSDEEIAAKYSQPERLYDGRFRRGLQSETVYHQPVCSVQPSTTCTDLTTGSPNPNVPYVIQCGQCVRLAVTDGSTLDFAGGLEIKGKLYFDSTADVTIKTQYIFVFGELTVDLPNPGNEVIFSLYGDSEHSFQASDANAKCGSGCNFGTKAIAVMGGTVDIKGYEDDCPAWEKLIHVGAPVVREFDPPCIGAECLALTLTGPCIEHGTVGSGAMRIMCPIEETVNLVLQGDPNQMVFTSVAPEEQGEWEAPADNFEITLQYPCSQSEYHTNLLGECMIMCPLVSTATVSDGDFNEMVFTSVAPLTPTPQYPPVLLFVIGACTDSPFHVSASGTTAITCPLHLTDSVIYGHDGPLIFKNEATGAEIPVEGVHHWAWLGTSIYFFPEAGITAADVNAAFPLYTVMSVYSAEPAGQQFEVDRVLHWSWGGTGLFFVPKNYAAWQCGAAATEFNKRIPSGYSIDVAYPENVVAGGQTASVSEVAHWAYGGTQIYFAPDITLADFNAKFPPGYSIQVEYTGLYDINSLIVSADAINCWTPGTELLLTSHTRYDDDKQVVTVVGVGTDTLTQLPTLLLDGPIERPLTLWDTQDYGIEVASLTRRVKFVAESTSYNPTIGGHFIIHNTDKIQSLKGIEITNFGQQGILGKYPLHFHDCGDSSGSIVKNNVIRDSNQRGYVVHLTNYVTLEHNVAMNVVGHCFFLEAGTERKNVFTGNLGAGIKRMSVTAEGLLSQQSGRLESDARASVFWISNAENSFYGNIAAGSQHFGVWFETIGDRIFGSLDAFYFNEIHSSERFAFTSYPPGWSPDGYASNIIHGLKVYRNSNWGAFLHVTRNLIFQDCLFADNGQYSILINRGDDIRFVNTRFIGKTEFAGHSPGCALGSVGIGLHPGRLQEFVRDGSISGSSVIDSTFENYSLSASECPFTPNYDAYFTPLQMRSEQVFWRAYNARHTLDNVYFDDSSLKLDSCDMYDQLAIEDTIIEITNDNSKVFSSSGVDGFLVTPKFSAMLPSPETCETYKTCPSSPGGLEFCPGVCLRTITILTDAAATDGVQFVVVDTNSLAYPQQEVVIDGQLRDGAIYFDRTFTAALPKGDFELYFKDSSGNRVWPAYADVVLESPPTSCSQYFTEEDYSFSMVGLQSSRTQCSNLISNSNFNTDISGWIARTFSPDQPAIFTPNEGFGGSGALKTVSRTSFQANSVEHNLDTTCLQVGDTYALTLKYRNVHTNGIDLPMCPGGGISCCTTTNLCVSATIKTVNFDRQSDTFTSNFMLLSRTNDMSNYPFYGISGMWTVTQQQVDADRVTLFLNEGTAQLILDDIILQKQP